MAMIRLLKCSTMKKFSFIILIFSLLSCKKEHEFDLNKDLYQFSEKMENGDTVKIKTNFPACTYFAFEEYTFTKQNDTLFVEKYSREDPSDRQQKLAKMMYKIKADDPLSFENYFKYLKKTDTIDKNDDWALVSVTYKNQRKRFYASNLRDQFEKIDTLNPVRKKIYPNDTFLQMEEPAPLKNKKS